MGDILNDGYARTNGWTDMAAFNKFKQEMQDVIIKHQVSLAQVKYVMKCVLAEIEEKNIIREY